MLGISQLFIVAVCIGVLYIGAWQKAYSETLHKQGSVLVEVTRCIITRPSMPELVYTSSEQYATGGSTLAWQQVNSDTMEQFLHECVTSQVCNVGRNHCEIEGKATEVESHSIEKAAESLEREYSRVMGKMRKEFEKKRSVSKMPKDTSFIYFLNTGSQPSFQDTLPLLLSAPCTYILVFNATEDLDQPVQNTNRCDDHTKMALPSSAKTGWQMLLRSLSSMQSLAHKCPKELAPFLQGQVPELHILVVGAYKDQIAQEKQMEVARNINLRLQQLKGQPYFRYIENDSAGRLVYFISNVADKQEQRRFVSTLRSHLSNAGSSLKIELPVKWYFFLQITQGTQYKFFRYEDLKDFCLKHKFIDEEGADEQFLSLLRLFTVLGFYSFFDVKDANYVCTDTGLFLKEISKVLAVQFTPPIGKEMRSFKNTGILSYSQPLFQQLGMSLEVNPIWLLSALEYLGIAAQMPFKDHLQYFIPAVLPQSSTIQQPSASFAPLCFTYKIQEGAEIFYNHLPRDIYCCLAVELIRRGWGITVMEKSRNSVLFHGQGFQFYLQESSGYITLIPQVLDEMSMLDLQASCKRLLSTIEECLSNSTKDALGSRFSTVAELAVGFECHCQEGISHLAVPSDSKRFLSCTETHKGRKATVQQRIWFSTVDTAKVSIDLHGHIGNYFSKCLHNMDCILPVSACVPR